MRIYITGRRYYDVNLGLLFRRFKRRTLGRFKMERPAYTEHNNEIITLPNAAALLVAEEQVCPFCHGPMYNGPEGGLSVNLFCGNVENCDSRFNLSALSFDGKVWQLEFTGITPATFKSALPHKSDYTF